MNAQEQSLQRLLTLQRLAAQQEDNAARQLADALAKHANAEDRRAELLQYEIEYAGRAPGAEGRSVDVAASVASLRHHAGFLSKLRDAVRFQAERVQQLSTEVDRQRARWMMLHREVEKLEQLSDATKRQLALIDSRKQARELDELAQRGWLRQRQVAG